MAEPVLTYLDRKELETIHNASLHILKNTGVIFPNQQALEL